MDRDVRPRVTYWTGVWAPGHEAISNEIACLRQASGRSWVVSCASHQRAGLDLLGRVLRVRPSAWPLLRMAAAGVERMGDVTHVFGRLDEWHLLRATGHRPVVFTVAIDAPPLRESAWGRVCVFVAETEALARSLVRAGVSRSYVRVIHPGVNLRRYTPSAPPPTTPFRVLFASSPSRVEEFDARGIPLLVETARRCPDTEIVLCWRNWGDGSAAERALRALDPPANVRMERVGPGGMAAMYASVHAVVCAYAPGFGKSAPNSIIEGLACGRPALVTEDCGLASVIVRGGAGESVGRSSVDLSAGIDALRASYHEYALAARRLAESTFDAARFCADYAGVYAELAGGAAPEVTARAATEITGATGSPRSSGAADGLRAGSVFNSPTSNFQLPHS